jgi:C4-dicarboxylate transporter DctM subunit
MVLYGVVRDTSIGGLFMAGVLPGLMIAAIFVAFSMARSTLRGSTVQREPRASLVEAGAAIRKAAWALSLPVLVLGGMYAGVFTATEAAAAGATLALLIGIVVYRTVGLREIWQAAIDASRTSAMLFMIVAGASVFAHVVTRMRIPQEIVQVVVGMDIGIGGFLIAMMVLIFILGMFLESVAIILVTTPVILPVMAQLHVDPIWYGVLLTINLELAQITPPVGMNLFTIRAISNAPLGDIIVGSMPYVLLLVLGLAIVMVWPQVALWLPGTMLNLR